MLSYSTENLNWVWNYSAMHAEEMSFEPLCTSVQQSCSRNAFAICSTLTVLNLYKNQAEAVGLSNGCTTFPLYRKPEFHSLPNQRSSLALLVQMLLQNHTAQKKARNKLQELSNWLRLPKMTACGSVAVSPVSHWVFLLCTSNSECAWRRLSLISDYALIGYGLMQPGFIVPPFSPAFGEIRNNALWTLYSGEQGLSHTTTPFVPHLFKSLMFSSTARTLPFVYSQMQKNLPESWCKSLRNIVCALQ